MALKAKEILEVRRKFDFVAPILSAKVKSKSHYTKNKKESKNFKDENLKDDNLSENKEIIKDDKESYLSSNQNNLQNIRLIDDANLLNNTFSLSEFSNLEGQGYNSTESEHSELQHGLDLNQLLAPQPNKLFIVQVTGESMIDENIFDGDLLLVDKYETPNDGKIIIASINGELVVKKLKKIDGKIYLFSANAKFLPIEILPLYNFQIQGVVKHVIHSV